MRHCENYSLQVNVKHDRYYKGGSLRNCLSYSVLLCAKQVFGNCNYGNVSSLNWFQFSIPVHSDSSFIPEQTINKCMACLFALSDLRNLNL